VCHKKAAKFEAWLSSAVQPNYILVADWREAKPCIEVTSKGFKFSQMIVYCETDSTFRKASEWACQLPFEAGLVHVVNSMDAAETHLLELLAKQSKGESETCSTASTVSDCESELPPNGMDIAPADRSEEELVQPAEGVPLASTVEHMWVPYMSVIAVPVVQVVAPAVNPVMDVLRPVFSSYTAQDLSQALAEAMPECYTD
jgi:hypothetical protein